MKNACIYGRALPSVAGCEYDGLAVPLTDLSPLLSLGRAVAHSPVCVCVFNNHVVLTEMPLSPWPWHSQGIALTLSHHSGKLRKVSFSQLGERRRIYESEKHIPDGE